MDPVSPRAALWAQFSTPADWFNRAVFTAFSFNWDWLRWSNFFGLEIYDWFVVMPREGLSNILSRATFSKQNQTIKYSRIDEAQRFLISDDESDAQRSIRAQLQTDGYRFYIFKIQIFWRIFFSEIFLKLLFDQLLFENIFRLCFCLKLFFEYVFSKTQFAKYFFEYIFS